jgi:glutathione synthase/RimK-type ligase-like ATP-grasp enzyme
VTQVALATCAAFPDLDDDERLTLAPLRELGLDPVPAVWDDPSVDWASFALVVVRTTWDYTERLPAFLAWAGLIDRLANPAAVLAWNTDKRYLGELAERGLPTVPTRFVAPGEPFALPEGADPDAEIVVKPTVSAGARGAGRFGPDARAAAIAHVEALHAAGATAMVQPYVAAVDADGETALLYLGGTYSHAIRKGPLLRPGAAPSDDLFAAEDIAAREPSPAERALADRAVAAATERLGPLLYARVDLLPGPGGEPLIIELELTEPSLFLRYGDGAPDRLAAAIAAAAAA